MCFRVLPSDRYGNARAVAEEELHVFVRGAARPLTQQVRCVGTWVGLGLGLGLGQV